VPNTLRIVCRFAPIRQKLLVYLTGRNHLIRVNIPQFQKGKNRPSGLFGGRHAGHQQTLSIQTLRADGRRINDFILLKKSSGIGPEPGRPHGDCPRVTPLDEAIAAIRDFCQHQKESIRFDGRAADSTPRYRARCFMPAQHNEIAKGKIASL
jgi:hypothetical protein